MSATFSMADYRTRDMLDPVSTNYVAYAYYRRRFSAVALKSIFPQHEAFERRFMEEQK